MKTFINHKKEEYLFVKVPKNAHSFREKLIMDGAGLYVSFEPRIEPYLALQSVKISKNNKESYQIISTTKDITEEQAIEYFTGESFLYSTDISGSWEGQLYSCDEDDETLAQTAKESLQSLLTSLGLDINHNYLILKKS